MRNRLVERLLFSLFFLIRRSSPGWFRNETTGSIRSTADTSTVDVTVADRKGKKKEESEKESDVHVDRRSGPIERKKNTKQK